MKLSTQMYSYVLTCALTGLATVPATAEPIVIKLSHVVAVNTPKGQGAERFKKLAEERTQGRVKIEVYPNSQLFKDKEDIEAMQLGSVQMLIETTSKFGPVGAKEFEVFDLPFITPDRDSFLRVADGPIGKKMLQSLEKYGIKGLAFWDAGFRVMSANRPLHRLADYKGLKMRINSSRVIDAQMRALGAIPQTLAFSEVYQGLQTGVVDGQENVMSNLWVNKFFEVQKHISITHHSHLAYAVIANKKFWDGLPDDIRTLLEGAVRDSTTYANQLGAEEEIDSIEKIKASGRSTIYVPSKAEIDELKKATSPLYQMMEGRLGRDNIAAVVKAAGGGVP
ncbi:MAG: DctP family TRAP transporter solute-binding subunit [Proteobacteria bacterium]|nr:DctP family TRAP transporter solute-binding subunit [Pseudomonadota bacterium]